jgi:hypothetical protein
MDQVIELEVADDITSIQNRIEFALPNLTQRSIQKTGRPGRVKLLLVVPFKNESLHSLVNMKLLARLVRARSVELAIVTSHPTIRDYAKAVGLKAFGSRRSAKWAGWITSQTPATPSSETPTPLRTSPSNQEKFAEWLASLRSVKKRRRKKKYEVVAGDHRSGLIRQILRQVGALLLLFILAVALVSGIIGLLPQATVTLTPIAQPVEAELIVKADPDMDSVNFKELTFPARIDQVELKIFGEIETVKTELAPAGKASGRVVFINRTEEAQTIPISTTVSTSAGEPVEFTLVQSATIPAGVGATSDPIRVVALEAGVRGNVRVAQINRFVNSAYALVARVVNEEPTGGGTLEPVRVVEQADKERLDAYLRQKIQQQGLDQLQAQLGEQEFIPPESVQVITLDIKYREFAGDVSNTFGGEMQAVVRATVIGGYNANRLALAALEAQVPPGYMLDLEGLNFGAGEVLDIQDRVVTFKIFARGQAIPEIDGHQVAEDIAWLPIGEAQSLLSQQYQLATVPGVDLQPEWLVNWLGRLPFSTIRINVVINEAVTLVAGRE